MILALQYIYVILPQAIEQVQIWKLSRFLNYFRSLRISDISGHCRRCDWLSVCRGGCKAANFSQGALFHSNRHCWLVTENEKTGQPELIS